MKQNSLLTTLMLGSVFLFRTTALHGATIDFETLPDSTAVGGFYSSQGVTFQNAISLAAGASLNELDFPPHSGAVVVGDDVLNNGDPMILTFSTPVNSLAGFFAYSSQLTFAAYDFGGNLLGTYNTPTGSHLGSMEEIFLPFSGVALLDISGALADTFTMDDLSFQQSASVPDTGATLPLLGGAFLVLWGLLRRTAVNHGERYFMKHATNLRILLGLVLVVALIAANQTQAVQQIDTPKATPAGVFAGEPTAVLVTAQVAVDADLLPTSVNLVRKLPSGQSVVIGRMYDDGTHGDALVGDQTFTLATQLNEPNSGSVVIYATTAYRGQRNRVSSPVTSIIVGKRPTDAQLNVATDVPTQGQQFFASRRAQVGDDQARNELLAALGTELGVVSFGVSPDGFYIWIVFDGGLRGGIITAPLGTRADPTYVGASKSAVLASFFDRFFPWDETDNIAQSLGNTCGGSPTPYKNQQATVDAFKTISGSGVVSITAHGAINGDNEVVILTREPVTLASQVAHFLDWTLFARLENWGGVWALRPNFVRAYCSFPDSIVYVGSCNSSANQTMADAFRSKGAKTYFGYTKVVNSPFAFSTGTALFNVLCDSSKQPQDRTTQKAFDSIANKTDPADPHAVFTMSGDGNVALRSELVVNGRFETDDFTGWNTDGFGYTKVVSEAKSEGSYSARIGRWDQLYSFYGGLNGPSVPGVEPYGTDSIYQDVDLSDSTSLPFSFDYNVVTFDGAAYDWLDVTVTDANTGAFLAKPVSQVGGIIAGSIDNWGLYYTTGWKHVSTDLAAFKGRKVRLTFSVMQDGYGDQIAAYIDNVSVRCH